MPVSLNPIVARTRAPQPPKPLSVSMAQYNSMRRDARNKVEEGSGIRTVGQFYCNGDWKADEFAAHLAHDTSAKAKLRSVPAAQRKEVVDGLIAWNSALRSKLPGAKIRQVVLPDAAGTRRVIGILVEPRKGAAQLFGYFPEQPGGMRLQYHGSSESRG